MYRLKLIHRPSNALREHYWQTILLQIIPTLMQSILLAGKIYLRNINNILNKIRCSLKYFCAVLGKPIIVDQNLRHLPPKSYKIPSECS